jgi:hypothetical protein
MKRTSYHYLGSQQSFTGVDAAALYTNVQNTLTHRILQYGRNKMLSGPNEHLPVARHLFLNRLSS